MAMQHEAVNDEHGARWSEWHARVIVLLWQLK